MYHTRETIMRPHWPTVLKGSACIIVFVACFLLIMGEDLPPEAKMVAVDESPEEAWVPFCTVEDMVSLQMTLNACTEDIEDLQAMLATCELVNNE